MTIAHHHAEWLSLLEINGPFLSLPVLLRAFPQGLDAADSEVTRELRLAYDEWQGEAAKARPDRKLHLMWVEWTLRRVLGMTAAVLRKGDGAAAFHTRLAEHGETLRADFAVVAPGSDPSQARLLVQVVPPGQGLERPLSGARWQASPATRLMTLLHATGVRLGLVTNGEQWMLVDAPRGETTDYTSWYATLWLEEPLTLRAFRSLLSLQRFFGVEDKDTIEGLLTESATQQQDVTEQLGNQVRRAVELLVQAIDVVDQDRGGALLQGVAETILYEAALFVMMRLVFLLSAEERGLLPLGEELYDQHYAVSTLRAQLRVQADQWGEEVLERRSDAWARLLATFRAVYGGVNHPRLTLPAYGGDLFDPDAFPFLEGRRGGTWRATPADPLPIDNRTVLHLLDALQVLTMRGPGGLREARRLSFRALDVEQIGHVYEGLLDHTAVRAETAVLGLVGSLEPEIPLPTLEAQRERGEVAFLDYLKDETGRSPASLRRLLTEPPSLERVQALRVACGDEDLLQRVLPFAGLVRDDDYGRPVVIRAGSVYVTAGTARRASGAHYTPRSLTEPIVQHTLEPLVYVGPAEGLPRDEWALRPATDLLRLKVCDMAMGSGAFLVQACRYLSERVVEAWERDEGRRTKDQRRKTTLHALRSTLHAPSDGVEEALAGLATATTAEERLTRARRLVAARCLYGVDKNPLAVEMAKLSLWLVTLARGEAFTFLDHALKSGDSLVGVDLEQLMRWSLAGEGQRTWDTAGMRADIEKVVELRREIEATPVHDIRDQQRKADLLADANRRTNDLRTGADLLVGSYFNTLGRAEQNDLRLRLLNYWRKGEDIPERLAQEVGLGEVRPFHWPLEFPEVFLADDHQGFDAFVGNPPFIGGKRIRDTLGDNYRQALYQLYPGSAGGADYSAFFFLRGYHHLQSDGTLGLIATNTIAQGDTRETGLATLVAEGGDIYRATNDQKWPGAAAVVVNVVHIAKGGGTLPHILDDRPVTHISDMLDDQEAIVAPYTLSANADKSFIGSFVNGMGFVLDPDEAQALIAKDPRNRNVLFPYLNGEDLNSRPDQSPSRWVINFFDWPLEQAEQYPDCMAIVREKVYPVRAQVNREAHRRYWWHYGDKRPALYRTIAPLRRVLICAQTTKYLCFSFVLRGWVFAHKTIVFAFDDPGHFSVLQSTFHEAWARTFCSTLETRLSYTPTDGFETFPFPESPIPNLQSPIPPLHSLASLGEAYHEHRRQTMLARQAGLTATYNRFHDPQETAEDIAALRALHVQLDEAVAAAYGWDDLRLEHGFHATPQGVRYTISDAARREVLARLLRLNHERHAQEVAAGQTSDVRREKSEGRGRRKGNEAGEEVQPRLV